MQRISHRNENHVEITCLKMFQRNLNANFKNRVRQACFQGFDIGINLLSLLCLWFIYSHLSLSYVS